MSVGPLGLMMLASPVGEMGSNPDSYKSTHVKLTSRDMLGNKMCLSHVNN